MSKVELRKCLCVVNVSLDFEELFHKVATNVLALGEEADFEALNFPPALNLIRSTKLHLSTEPAFLPNACYVPLFSFGFIILNTSYNFLFNI